MGGGYNESESNNFSVSGSTPQQIMENYSRYLPEYLRMNTEQIPAYVNAISNAGLASTRGAGGQLAQEISSLSSSLNPSTGVASNAANNANTSAIMAQGASNNAVQNAQRGVDAISLGGLSPGEANSIERSLNQTNAGNGNLGLVNPMNTISNAMNFGGAYNSKVGLFNNAVNTSIGAANNAASIPGSFANASGAASGAANSLTASNAGINALANPATSATTSSLANSGLLNNVSTGTFSTGNGSSSSMGVNGSTGCCFIFMEAYKGTMPPVIRKGRDRYYKVNPDIAIGYCRMAKWLVPLMREYSTVRSIVWHLMVKPATEHLKHPKKGFNKTISHLWLRVWAIAGANKLRPVYV